MIKKRQLPWEDNTESNNENKQSDAYSVFEQRVWSGLGESLEDVADDLKNRNKSISNSLAEVSLLLYQFENNKIDKDAFVYGIRKNIASAFRHNRWLVDAADNIMKCNKIAKDQLTIK